MSRPFAAIGGLLVGDEFNLVTIGVGEVGGVCLRSAGVGMPICEQ